MTWDYSDMKKWGWQKHPRGAVIPQAGTADDYKTGGWRSQRPVLDKEKCINCFFCFIYCPDTAIVVEEEDMKGFNLKHCKGCGICAHECPKDAIAMVDEIKAKQQDEAASA